MISKTLILFQNSNQETGGSSSASLYIVKQHAQSQNITVPSFYVAEQQRRD